MAFINLDVEIDYDFEVIAISCNQKAHTLCWAINRSLGSELRLADNYILKGKKAVVQYKKYTSNKEEFCFNLLCNKYLNQRLVPELPTVDYLIKIYEDDSPYSIEELVSSLRKLRVVQAVYALSVSNLKSKQVFIFD